MRLDFRKTIIYAGIAVLLMGAAFVFGTAVSADVSGGAVPGSSADPLVSESYVKARVAALEAKIAELEAQVAQLEKGAGIVSSGKTGTTGTTGNSGNSGPTGSAGSSGTTGNSSTSGTSGTSGNSTGSGSVTTGSTGPAGTTSPIDSTNFSMTSKKVIILPLQTAANIRSAPNLQAAVLIKANSGASLTWLQTSGEWYKVQLLDGRAGWVHNSVARLA